MYQDLIYKLAKVDKFLSTNLDLHVSINKNLVCLDELKLSISQINEVISEIKVNYKGCVLLKASVNALCLEVENKTKEQALRIIDNFLGMIDNSQFDTEALSENLKVFELFKESLTRRDCLRLGALQLKKLLST